MDSMVYWIWLSLCCTPGNKTFASLLKRFRTPEEVFAADNKFLSEHIESDHDAEAICKKDLTEAEKIYDFCLTRHVGLLTYADERFPDALRKIKNPPVLLYYRGVLPDFSSGLYVAVVGTRALSSYGRRVAFSTGHDLALAGTTVVSGMAIGIDGVAMAGALSCEKPTIAFLGCGIDICYPEVHLTLAREIVKRGCIFTEYPPGTRPIGSHFPVRNRLISGISHAVIVVEGGSHSGALLTARHAKEQGKPVYAVPSNVDNRSGAASNLLIRDGAKLLFSADDVIRDFYESDIPGLHLDPFSMPKDAHIPQALMDSVLATYKVACVTPGDPIFNPSRAAPRQTKEQPPARPAPTFSPAAVSPEADIDRPLRVAASAPPLAEAPITGEQVFPTNPPIGLNRELIDLYHKIPYGQECPLESLVDEKHTLRDVSEGLLKLEMLRMVTLLPGEKVRRM